MHSRGLYLLLLMLAGGPATAQMMDPVTDPLEGRIVFEEKKCISCHAIGGYGGTAGPDLSRDEYFGSAMDLAAVIWNHAPQMNRKFRQLRMDRPRLTEKEMLSLMGFLYYLRYLGEPGSVSNGKRLLESKGCLGCHSIQGKGGTIGPDFTKILRFSAPLYMVQAMWNHGPMMEEEIRRSGKKFPVLSGQDIVDIASYLRQASTSEAEIRLSPGNPKKGRELFESKGCSGCHVGEGKTKRIEPGLTRIDMKRGVTEVASTMWNHGFKMMERMKKMSIEWPKFNGNEMADIIAYIYFLGFEDRPGDARRGEQVFTSKGCIDCHAKGGGGKGMDLATVTGFDSPIKMVQLMWNHASEMEDLIISQNKEWPQLSRKELNDLYMYLQTASKHP